MAQPPAQEQEVTPYIVTSGAAGVDYNKLIVQFGTERISDELLARFERLAKKPLHPFLKRHLFFSHRSLNEILDHVEKGQPFYLYTGRGPSSDALHLGHMIPFIFTKYLQEAFDVPLVIQLTDDEKFFFKNFSLEEAHDLAFENAKDIIAVGFDVERTFIFTDYDYYGKMYPNIAKIQKLLTANQVRAALGLAATGEDNIGKYAYTAIQAAPSFSSSFPDIFGPCSNVPVLIPCGIDQDPFFRMTRDVAPRMRPEGYLKPAVIHSKFFPALGGANSKMSASDPTSAIFMTDTPEQIATKIRDHAFSGAPKDAAEHRARGANLDVDVSIAYLDVFLDDDARMAKIKDAYRRGEMAEAEVKAALISVLQPLVAEHQAARKAITPDVMHKFFTPRPLRCFGKPFAPVMVRPAAPVAAAAKGGKGGAAPAAAGGAAAAAKVSDFAKVDIRVGRVLSVERHPSAENLYIESIDLGEAAPRTVVSGLVKFMPAEAIANRLVVVVCNLAPRPLQGVNSAGMVLTAESADGSVVELLEAPSGALPGERVACEGEEGTPDAVPLSRKVFDRVMPELKTNDACVGVYKGKVLACAAGPLKAKTVKAGKLK